MSDRTKTPLESCPTVISYLTRIGAKFRTMFRAVIVVDSLGYEKEIYSVTFSRQGDVRAPQNIAPTAQETEAIRLEIQGLKFPEQMFLTNVSNSTLPEMILNAEEKNVFKFYDQENRLVFVQVRIELSNGDKRYVPWTYWSDGEWRIAEPEKNLPIYNFDRVKKGCRVFLHEGAKAARAADQLSNSLTHPFADYLSTGVNIGWIGGTHQFYKTDWEELNRLAGEIIIIPDNDFAGKIVVSKLVKKFTCPTFCLQLTSDWPAAWDFADDIPAKYFSSSGKYIGPALEEMIEPCDWATEEIGETDSGRPIYGIREHFASKWVRVQELRHYANLYRPEETLDRDQFNVKVAPYSNVADTAALLNKISGNICDKVTFMPNKPSGIIRLDGATCLNQYVDRRVKPLAGETKPFWDFLGYLVPSEKEREHVVRWMATLYARPDIRMGYGLLLLSKKQGVGKSTLLDIMALLIGKQHVSFPGDAMIQGDFNGWMINRRLVIVHEIYAGQNWKTYNRLKSYITDENLEANKKHVTNYTLPNWAHFGAASNSMEALRMEHDDRRWFVPKLPDLLYDNYNELRRWVDDGGVRALAHELLHRNDYVGPGETAPQTASKLALIDQSMPPDERLVLMLTERLSRDFCLDLNDIWLWLQEEAKGRTYVTPQRIASLLGENGYCVDERVRIGSRDRQIVWASPEDRKKALEGLSGAALEKKKVERLKTPAEVFRNEAAM